MRISWARALSQQQLNVVRRVYQQETLNKDADYKLPERTASERFRKVVRNCGFGDCLLNSIPIIKWLPQYSCQKYMLGDLIAGATTAVMHIPQGMAYALLAEVPPIVGLYMAFFPVLIYVLLVIGIGVDHDNNMHYSPLEVVSVVCLLVGIFQTFVEVCKNLPNLNWAAFVISFITCLIIALNNERLKGASNMFASFFGCSPFCASLSRSYIQYQVLGSKQAGCSGMASHIPHHLMHQHRYWSGAGLLASVGALFIRSQNPYTCLLGKVLDTDLYLDIKRYRAAEELPGIKIFHYCGGLNFATKNLFREKLFRKIGYMKPIEVVHCVIIDVTALSYVDGPGIKSLVAAQKELVANNIAVLLAGANGPVLEMIDRYNSIETDILQMETFPTVHDAVLFYRHLESKKHVTVTVTT
ncbi:hypothetical protein HF086_004438 [Spodoptera exigua]|uniref:STAS domain-containing protein n=1 Tax=Spodoptera exigua TaxID=7107 RepID=A0A922MLX9_SPOEX|nr:hypothetical protein HF086_004438 [Spodoptera exigua]